MPETRVVIIGAGFAGLEVARGLVSSSLLARVTLIDRNNFQLFQPLLYQVATAALSPADVARAVRKIVHGGSEVDVLLGDVTEISASDGCVVLADDSRIAYDILVIAAGAAVSYFGHDQWRPFAPGLKTIHDATIIRSRFLRAFEEAEASNSPLERRRLMTFVIVGGGPSGVELAGSIAEFVRHAAPGDFRTIDPRSATVFLLEKGPRVLPSFPQKLSEYARGQLETLGVKVQENCTVEEIGDSAVRSEHGEIPAGLVIWTAGVKASPIGAILGAPTDDRGRIKTKRDLSVPGFKNVYALGDIALVHDQDGKPLPGLAQVAKQQGRYLGRALARKLRSSAAPKPFLFRNRGNIAVIGRCAAVADFGRLTLTGFGAWLIWAVVHIYFLAGLQNRFLVTTQWLWRYFTYDRAARVIIEPAGRNGGRPC